MGQSFHLSDYYGKHLLAEKHWTVEEKLRELNSMHALFTAGLPSKSIKQRSPQPRFRLMSGNYYLEYRCGF